MAKSKIRIYLFSLLTVIAVLLTIFSSWKVFESPRATKQRSYKLTEQQNLQEKVYQIQAEIVLGSFIFFKNKQDSFGWSDKQVKQITDQVLDSFKDSYSKENSRNLARDALRTRLVVGQELGIELESLISTLERKQQKSILLVDSFLLELIKNEAPIPISEDKQEVIIDKLGWRGKLLLANNAEGNVSDYKSEVEEQLEKSFVKFAFGIAFFALFALVSLIVCLFMAIWFIGGKAKSTFVPSDIPYELLEIFCVYLILMLGGSVLASELIDRQIIEPTISLQAWIILGTLVALFWPMLSGIGFSKTRKALGLYSGGVKAFLRDVFVTPFVYIGAWTPFFIILLIYSVVLSVSGIDAAEGGHPIVPVLLSSKGSNQFIIIVLLAVVVAPVVEEIMFRGALYGWLRTRASAFGSILISALIFAAVHPQGPLGIVPLTMIGMFLAALREWRNSLVAPMIAHACVNGGTLLIVVNLFS